MVKRSRLPRRSRMIVLDTDILREVEQLEMSGHGFDEIVSYVAYKYFEGDEGRAEVWLAHVR